MIKQFILNALKEDMPQGDVTTDNLIPISHYSEANYIAKEDGVISGIEYLDQIFKELNGKYSLITYVNSGDFVQKGKIIATIKGDTRLILKGERLSLNLIQYMSGIATMTNKYKNELEGNTKLLDTRKTTPNMRIFAKQAVKDGGGQNHRYSLSDMVMIKDNHIVAAGSITNAVKKIKALTNLKIEVEVESIDMFKEALKTECDIIMLDNMSLNNMRECVLLNKENNLTKPKELEASGNMTLERIREVSKTGVDYISVGALTHSFKSLDISLKFK